MLLNSLISYHRMSPLNEGELFANSMQARTLFSEEL